MTDEKHQLHAIVKGRVQGVNFRYYTMMRASELHLTGWVRNLPERAVEVTAEGTRAQLEQLLMFLNQGPPSAHVTSVEVEWRAASGKYTDFEITG